jgi:hypothetical protein
MFELCSPEKQSQPNQPKTFMIQGTLTKEEQAAIAKAGLLPADAGKADAVPGTGAGEVPHLVPDDKKAKAKAAKAAAKSAKAAARAAEKAEKAATKTKPKKKPAACVMKRPARAQSGSPVSPLRPTDDEQIPTKPISEQIPDDEQIPTEPISEQIPAEQASSPQPKKQKKTGEKQSEGEVKSEREKDSPSQKKPEEGDDLVTEGLDSLVKNPDTLEWPSKTTFAGRYESTNSQGCIMWNIRRETFYNYIRQDLWSEANERLFWTVFKPDCTAYQAIKKFHKERR